MATWYLCPNCTRSINRFPALPPLSVVTTCKHCGQPVERSVGSIAQAWVFFAPLVTWASAALYFHLVSADPESQASFAYCLGKGLPIAFLAIPVGGAFGWILGVLMGAPARERVMTGLQMLTASQIYEESQAQKRMRLLPSIAPPPTAKEIRCWHCATIMLVPAAEGPVEVRCSKCRAGLGIVQGA